MKLSAKVGARGQAVIPKPIRDQMGIQAGDEVYFRIEDDEIVVELEPGEEILEAFLEALDREPEPDEIDWDRAYGQRFREET